MKNLFLTDVYIPKGYEFLLDAEMPHAAVIYPVVGLVMVLIVAIIMAVMVAKKHKMEILPIFAGATIYMFFGYFVVGIVSMFIPAGNIAVYIAVVSLLTAFVPFMGRLFFIKMFAKKHNNLASHLGYGIGFMGMRALMNLLMFVYPILYYSQINQNGIAAYFPADAEEDVALEMAQTLEQILKTNYSHYILLALITVALIVFGLAVSMPIYAAFTGRKSKSWYGFALGMGVVVAVAEVLYTNEVLVVPAIILALVASGVTAFFAIKLYIELAANEPEETKDDNDEAGSITKNAHTKIPKFSNLDKL